MDLNFHEVLYKSNYAKVYKAVYKIIGNDYHLVQDVIQEAFIKGFKNLHQLKEKDKFAAWITSIATNAAIDELRKYKRQLPVNHLTLEMEVGDLPANNNMLPESIYDKVEIQKELLDAISQLDIWYRQTIYLKYYFDLTDKEIALFLNVKEATVRSRLTRARQTLKMSLSKKAANEEVATGFEG